MKKKYALVGTGGRAEFFYGAMVERYRETTALVAFCDTNQTRMDYSNKLLAEKYEHPKIATYLADQFEIMIQEKNQIQ